MINAKNELLAELKNTGSEILCANLWFQATAFTDNVDIQLKLAYTPEDLAEFLQKLDFGYDNGYGGQRLFGTIWLKDGTWLERGEYDGSEWWEHRVLPAIPEELK